MKDDKRLKRKVRNSYIVSTVSIMLVLFLLGSVGYLMVAAMKVAQTLQESIAVTVELQNGITDQQRETINKRLTAEELVATVAYVTKEEKADDAEFRKMFESEFEEILDENPLLDSFELTLTAESADKELLDGFIASVSGIAGVERVSYPALMAERLHATVGKIRLVLLLFGGALLIISLILLSNTIRLAIFSKRYLINTMKLVGATKWFIMKPFLGSSITQSILSGQTKVSKADMHRLAKAAYNDRAQTLQDILHPELKVEPKPDADGVIRVPGKAPVMPFRKFESIYDSDAYPEDLRYRYVALEDVTTRFRIAFNYQLEQMPDNAQRDVILEIIHKHKDYLASLEAALADVKDQTA